MTREILGNTLRIQGNERPVRCPALSRSERRLNSLEAAGWCMLTGNRTRLSGREKNESWVMMRNGRASVYDCMIVRRQFFFPPEEGTRKHLHYSVIHNETTTLSAAEFDWNDCRLISYRVMNVNINQQDSLILLAVAIVPSKPIVSSAKFHSHFECYSNYVFERC